MQNETLPRWDMTPIFPSLCAPEFTAEFESALDSIGELEALFDQVVVASYAGRCFARES